MFVFSVQSCVVDVAELFKKKLCISKKTMKTFIRIETVCFKGIKNVRIEDRMSLRSGMSRRWKRRRGRGRKSKEDNTKPFVLKKVIHTSFVTQ